MPPTGSILRSVITMSMSSGRLANSSIANLPPVNEVTRWPAFSSTADTPSRTVPLSSITKMFAICSSPFRQR